MAYFDNVRTEDELNNLFRKILIKVDYRNPKNEKLVKAIRKEYDEKLLQIKRANGYQTMGEKAVNYFKEKIKEGEQQQLQEKRRIEQLKSKKFTKQEYIDLISKEKYYINRIIENAVKNENIVYLSLKAKTRTNNYVEVYRLFTNNSILLQQIVAPDTYNSIREEIEYATEYFSESKKQYNNLMNELDTMFGKFINQCIIKYEDMYLDPIKIQETDSRYGNNTKVHGNLNSALHKLFTIPAYVLLVITLIYALTEEPSAIVISIVCGIWAIMMELWYIFVVKPYERRKNRIRTHNQAVEEGKLSTGLAHLLSSFLR